MSAPPNNWNTNSSYNKFNGSYIKSGDLDVSGGHIVCRNGNIYVAPYSHIYSTGNDIYFDDTYNYINIANNAHIYGTLQLDYGGITYNVGYDVVNTRTILTNVSYDSGTNTTTINGNLSITNPPTMSGANISAGTIPSSALVSGGAYVDLTSAQSVGGIKTFTSPPVLSGASISSGTIPTSALAGSFVDLTSAQSVGGIKTFTSPPVMSGSSISANSIPISAVATGFCDLASTQTLSGSKTFSSIITLSAGIQIPSPATTLSSNNLSYLGGSTSNIQTQLNNRVQLAGAQNITGTKTYTVQQNFSNDLRLDGSLLLNAGALTVSNANLQKIQYLSNVSSDINTSLTNLNTKTTNISYTSGTNTTTISGNVTISNPPTMSGANISANSIPDSALVLGGAYVNLSTNQTVGGNKVFSNTLQVNNLLQIYHSASTVGLYLSQANSSEFIGYNGSMTNGSVTDYSEGLILRSSNYGLEIQAGRVGTTETFNLCFHNATNPVILLSAQNTGTPANNVLSLTGQLNINGTNILTTLSNYQPLGTVIMNVSASIGAPYLLCDGRAISRTTYSGLFALISTTYGAGDGTTTFNIPNFQACFLRGAGSQTIGGVSYSGNALGTPQQDNIQDHNHLPQSGGYLNTSTNTTTINGYSAIATSKPNSSSFANTGNINSGSARLGAETRPVNYSIYYYIRAL